MRPPDVRHPASHAAEAVLWAAGTVGAADFVTKLAHAAPAVRSPLEWTPSEVAAVCVAFSTACASLKALIECVKGLFRRPPSPPAPAPA